MEAFDLQAARAQADQRRLNDEAQLQRLKGIEYGYELEAERAEQIMRARAGVLNFTLATFPKYQINWHHKEFAKILNRFARKEIKRLIVTMPPRVGKSELFSRRLPAFLLGKNPDARVIAASYSAELASSFNRDIQRIIDSDPYRRIFPETQLAGEYAKSSRTSTWVRNTTLFEVVDHRGSYRCLGVGGAVTGVGGDFILVDDPIKNQQEADSLVYRDRLYNWYITTLYTRLEKDACIGLTLTRWHEDDLIGRVLKHAKDDPEADQWVVVNFPMIAEEGPHGVDPREAGEVLWPEKYDLKAVTSIKSNLGARAFSALHQQKPAPDVGLIVQRSWWRYYDLMPSSLDFLLQAWDLTFKGKRQDNRGKKAETTDFVVGVLLGVKGADIYVLDMVRDRMTFTESVAAVKKLSKRWPQCELKLVEEAANGPALMDTLRTSVPGLVGVLPIGSKVARANAVAPRIEAGNLWLPTRDLAPGWGGPDGDIVEEWTAFPAGTNDDIVDAMSHGILRIMSMPPSDFVPVSIEGRNKFDW